MYEPMNDIQLRGAIEALLFVTDEPVSVLTLADMLQDDPKRIEAACAALQAEFEQAERGIQLREAAGGWRLVTHPQYHDLIERYVVSWDTRKLTQAALEALAIVAYCQPVTRAGVSSVRGVNTDSSMNSLLEKGYIREVGTQDAPGNPVLYGTTKTFLDRFGLTSVADLPPLESFAPDEETRAFIAERLNVVPADQVIELPNGLAEEASRGATELSETVQEAMQTMLSDVLAQSVGVVDKIDFGTLVFEED